jgi:hypothetical protein
MSTKTYTPQVIVREAEETDIPAILSLLLTSFRQFPLFTYLYSPLDENKDAARDTVFFWRRRILLGLLDPSVKIIVAEVPETLSPAAATSSDTEDLVELESQRMLDWIELNGTLSQASKKTPGGVVAGFAIWRDREGHGSSSKEKPELQKPDLISWSRCECSAENGNCSAVRNKLLMERRSLRLAAFLLSLEGRFWSMVYKRQDVNLVRYRDYSEAEEILAEQYVSNTRLYFGTQLLINIDSIKNDATISTIFALTFDSNA